MHGQRLGVAAQCGIMRILLVEDAPRLRQTIATSLAKLGHKVEEAPDGREGALRLEGPHHYDVVVMDIMMPGLNGLDVLAQMRRRQDDTPVLLLTARDAIEDRVRGLQAGADDYLVKPFALEELEARVLALHRRRYGQAHSVLRCGPLEIDTTARLVRRDGAEIVLTAREYSLLELLALRPHQVLSREQIENRLYAEHETPLSNAVDSAICQLRRKLSPNGEPPLIQTRRGLGYVLLPE